MPLYTGIFANGGYGAGATYETGSEDLTFPATGINPPGAVSDPARDSSTGLLVFSGSADNMIAGVAEMPHGWRAGTAIEPHLHLRFLAANTSVSRWKLEYDRVALNDVAESAIGTYAHTTTISVTNPNNVRKEVYASFGNVEMTGYGFSCDITWRITRLASTDVLDTDASDIVLTFFDIHYDRYRFGHNL